MIHLTVVEVVEDWKYVISSLEMGIYYIEHFSQRAIFILLEISYNNINTIITNKNIIKSEKYLHGKYQHKSNMFSILFFGNNKQAEIAGSFLMKT